MSGAAEPLPGLGLPGVDVPEPEQAAGFIEQQLRVQIERQRAAGELDDRHAGRVALAVIAARRADRLRANEKAYGVAQVLGAVKQCFELLPEPVAAQESDAFKAIVQQIQAAPAFDDEDVQPDPALPEE